MRSPATRHRPGVAMPLVLISLATASIITVAYFASRDNSSAIGTNVVAAAEAQAEAISALEIGVAILQTEVDWKNKHVNGKLLDDYVLGNAVIDLDVIDTDTGQPPTDATTNVQLICTSVVGGVQQVATANATVDESQKDGGRVDVDLSEFAVFASSKLLMRNDAVMTRWPTAPKAVEGRRVAVGTKETRASSIEIKDNAASIDTTIYHGPGVSGSLVSRSSGPVVDQHGLLDQMPLPEPPAPGVTKSATPFIWPNGHLDGQQATISAPAHFYRTELKNNSKLTIQGDVAVIYEDDLWLKSDSKVIIDGDVRIVVFGDFYVDDGSIELTPGSRLTVFVHGDGGSHSGYFKDAYIGEQRAPGDDTRDTSGYEEWMNPGRIRMFSIKDPSIDEVEDMEKWRIEGVSVIKASLYIPHVQELEVKDSSALYGRVATLAVDISQNGAVFYDHSLDKRFGFTNPDSMLFDGSGRIKAAAKTLSSLDDATLDALATALGTVVENGDKTHGNVVEGDPPPPPPGDPTPRPIPVEHRYKMWGYDTDDWEDD